jgi:hypothetical protein
MRRLRPVLEAEVIAEFLRNEFYEAEYHRDRNRFEKMVLRPDFNNEEENGFRRALLFRRRGHMWRELPRDTEWWQVELESQDAELIHVFPRAQWRKISNGSFCISDVVKRIRERGHLDGGNRVISKIQQMRYRMQSNIEPTTTVLLIGMDEDHPVTIFEGNHRLSAAMLIGPHTLGTRFHVMCGFSQRMRECCWYETNMANLWRYAKHRMVNIYDREADVERLLLAQSAAAEPKIERSLANAAVADKLTESQS